MLHIFIQRSVIDCSTHTLLINHTSRVLRSEIAQHAIMQNIDLIDKGLRLRLQDLKNAQELDILKLKKLFQNMRKEMNE